MPHTPHARLLNQAAREVLEPLGLTHSARSRFWYDDRGWRLILVEFQPSSVSRGSFLNVGLMWLWDEREHFTFDDGYRQQGFVEFHHKSQFEREALRLAQQAAAKVEAYRGQFPHVAAVAEYLLRQCRAGHRWDLFHAGVACGLAGRTDDAARFLGQLDEVAKAGQDESPRRKAAQWLTLLPDAARFRLAVEQAVLTTRAAYGLCDADGVQFEE
jgi:hypothetical protein